MSEVDELDDEAVDEALDPKPHELDELSDSARQRARDKFREHHLDYDWWDHVYSEAKTVAELFGMKVGEHAEAHGNRHGTRMVYVPHIHFSGFYTQGDGACWNGQIHTGELAGAIERVKGYAPNDNELTTLAELAEKLHAEIASQAAINRLCADDVNRDWPDVEIGMQLTVNGNERNWSTSIDGSDVSNDIEKIADKLVSEFADWIYKQLENEYSYQMDDEQIDAAIEFAGLTFDEDGNEL